MEKASYRLLRGEMLVRILPDLREIGEQSQAYSQVSLGPRPSEEDEIFNKWYSIQTLYKVNHKFLSIYTSPVVRNGT